MELQDWIDELTGVLDLEIEIDEVLILDVARQAAHQVQRPAAPITTFLLGYAAARGGGSQRSLEQLAQRCNELAARWAEAS